MAVLLLNYMETINMGKLILVRHGETNKNVNHALHSPNDQETLNSVGRDQIKKTADKLKKLDVVKIYSSKEPRAIDSADLLASLLGLVNEPIDGMQERNWGIFTGKPWEAVKKVLDPMSLEERYTYEPENGESWKVFETRLIKAIKSIMSDNPDKEIAVVTHGGVIRVLMPHLLNVPKEESFKYDPDNASLTIFEFNGSEFKQIAINDTSHL